MSRYFTGPTNNRYAEKQAPTAIPLNAPYTAAIRYLPVSFANLSTLIALVDLASLNNLWMLYVNATANVLYRIRTTTNLNISGLGQCVQGSWLSALAVCSADNLHACHWAQWGDATFHMGSSGTLKVPSAQTSPALVIGLDRAGGSTTQAPANGYLADAAVWNVALGTEEISAYHRGVSPLRIHPSALVSYWPLHGLASPEPDYKVGGANPLTLVNSPPKAPDHPQSWRYGWAFGADIPSEIHLALAAGVGAGASQVGQVDYDLVASMALGAVQGQNALIAFVSAIAPQTGVVAAISPGQLFEASVAMAIQAGAGQAPAVAFGLYAVHQAATAHTGLAGFAFRPEIVTSIVAGLVTVARLDIQAVVSVALALVTELGAGAAPILQGLVRLFPALAGNVEIQRVLEGTVSLNREDVE